HRSPSPEGSNPAASTRPRAPSLGSPTSPGRADGAALQINTHESEEIEAFCGCRHTNDARLSSIHRTAVRRVKRSKSPAWKGAAVHDASQPPRGGPVAIARRFGPWTEP